MPGGLATLESNGIWQYARHLSLIEDKLLDVANGKINRLMVSIPPQNGKSVLISHYFPAWYLGRFPDKKIIVTSYEATFAATWSRAARNTLEEFGPSVFGVKVSQRTASSEHWLIEGHSGGMTSAGAGGSITGRGADCCVGSSVIHTSCGNIRIDELASMKDKPQVLSYNHVTRQLEYKNVIATRRTYTRNVIEITTNSGCKLQATPNHRIYTHEHDYTQAGVLGGWETLAVYEEEQELCDMQQVNVRGNKSPYVQAMLSRGKGSKLFNSMFNLWDRIYASTVRSGQEVKSWINRFLLQPRLCSTFPIKEMQKVWNTYRIQEQTILRCLLISQKKRDWYAEQEKVEMQNLWGIYTHWKWTLQILQRRMFWTRVSTYIYEDTPLDQEAGQTTLCDMQIKTQFGSTSYRRESTKQRTCKSNNSMFWMPYQTSQVCKDSISSIRRHSCEEQPVYDIQVEGNSNFFANKILVHNCIIIDDPIKNNIEALSPTRQKAIREWYQTVCYTRLSPTGAIIVVMTRWVHDDLIGYLKSEMAKEGDQWVDICLPAIAKEDDLLGRDLGEALWPGKYPLKWLEQRRNVLQSFWWEAMYQQNPSPRSGYVVKVEKFKRFRVRPKVMDDVQVVLSLDTAQKETEISDYTVIGVWFISDNAYYLIDVIRERYDYTRLLQMTSNLISRWKPHVVLIEDKGSGISLIQHLQKNTTASVFSVEPIVSKHIRMTVEAGVIEAGQVYLPEDGTEDWLYDYIEELRAFPNSLHKDQVDMTSQFLKYARERLSLEIEMW